MFRNLVVSFEEYQQDPSKVLQDANLVVSINDNIYTYTDAMSIIMSMVVFRQCLDEGRKPNSLNSYAVDYEKDKEQNKLAEIISQNAMLNQTNDAENENQ